MSAWWWPCVLEGAGASIAMAMAARMLECCKGAKGVKSVKSVESVESVEGVEDREESSGRCR
jgi:hypothetical protein